jgi:hypothetical protein
MIIPATVSKLALSAKIELADTLNADKIEFNAQYALR